MHKSIGTVVPSCGAFHERQVFLQTTSYKTRKPSPLMKTSTVDVVRCQEVHTRVCMSQSGSLSQPIAMHLSLRQGLSCSWQHTWKQAMLHVHKRHEAGVQKQVRR